MTANYLITDFGFKRRTKNKEKLLMNDEYGITLKALEGHTNSFIDINSKEKYFHIGDIVTKFALEGIEKDSKRFHAGLPNHNLRQGNFDVAYTENTQKDEFFISHEKAKRLLKAQFNRLICGPLMCSSKAPNYDYYIKETKYEFRKSNIVTLTLYYNYKDRTGYHDFWITHRIHDFDKDSFIVNDRISSKVSLNLIIDKFIIDN